MPLRIAKSGASIATFRIIDTDSDAFNFLTAAGITNTTQRNAINKLVIDLKYYNLWTKQRALYPVVGGVAASHAVNLKTPGTYNLTFGSGWTHSSTGMLPNGTSGCYANTFLAANVMNQDSVHISYYSRTDEVGGSTAEMGVYQTTPTPAIISIMYTKNVSNNLQIPINQSGVGSLAANPNSTGYYIGSRTASNSIKSFKNGRLVINATTVSVGASSYYYYLGGYNTNNAANSYAPSSKECAFASIGDGLTDQDALNFYNIVQRYQTNLSRQV